MMFAQPSSTPLCQRMNVIMTRLRRLIQIARNPYRPELHYMRGPVQSGTRNIRAASKTTRFESDWEMTSLIHCGSGRF